MMTCLVGRIQTDSFSRLLDNYLFQFFYKERWSLRLSQKSKICETMTKFWLSRMQTARTCTKCTYGDRKIWKKLTLKPLVATNKNGKIHYKILKISPTKVRQYFSPSPFYFFAKIELLLLLVVVVICCFYSLVDDVDNDENANIVVFFGQRFVGFLFFIL